MSSDPSQAAQASPSSIHVAERASGTSGAVLRGPEIDFAAAVARRQAGLDVVVCGDNLTANRSLAQQIEASVGPYQRGVPHSRWAGPLALPHFQQLQASHGGHTFYETPQRKTRKRT
jgi:hypothetical protein